VQFDKVSLVKEAVERLKSHAISRPIREHIGALERENNGLYVKERISI